MKSLASYYRRYAVLAFVTCLSVIALPASIHNRAKASILATQSMPCFQCLPGDEGQVFSVPGGMIRVTIKPGMSLAISDIFLLNPADPFVLPPILIGNSSEAGRSVCLGPFPPGRELIFQINVPPPFPVGPYRTGSRSRNPDGAPHARVACQSGTTTISFEDLPAPGSDFDFNDVVIELTCCDRKCDTIPFHSAQFFLNKINRNNAALWPHDTVLIGGMNFNIPVGIAGHTDDIQSVLRNGCGNLFTTTPTPLALLNQQYVAAQLSMAFAGGRGSPTVFNALWTPLGCPSLLGNFMPVALGNGFIVNSDTMLKELFAQADFAIRENRAADMRALANLIHALNGDDPFGYNPRPAFACDPCIASCPAPGCDPLTQSCLPDICRRCR